MSLVADGLHLRRDVLRVIIGRLHGYIHRFDLLRDLFDEALDLSENLAQSIDARRAVLHSLAARLHRGDGRIRILLNGHDEFGDALCRFRRFRCELAHLVGDDGEAAAMLARARCLDGRIERQQVRLLCDARNRLDNRADFLRPRAELVDDGRRLRDILRGRLDLLDAAAHFLCTGRCILCRRFGALCGLARLRPDVIDAAADLPDGLGTRIDRALLLSDRACRIRHRLRNLVRRLCRLLRARRELLARRRNLLSRVVRLVHEAVEAVTHVDDDIRHVAKFIPAHNFLFRQAEIAIAEPAAGIHHVMERCRDFPRNPDGEDDEQRKRDEAVDEHQHARTRRLRLNILIRRLGRIAHAPLLLLKSRAQVCRLLRRIFRIISSCPGFVARCLQVDDAINRSIKCFPSVLNVRDIAIKLCYGLHLRTLIALHVLVELLLDFLNVLAQVLEPRLVMRRHRECRARLHIAHHVLRIADAINLLQILLVNDFQTVVRRLDGRASHEADGRHPKRRHDDKDQNLVHDPQILDNPHKNTLFLNILP